MREGGGAADAAVCNAVLMYKAPILDKYFHAYQVQLGVCMQPRRSWDHYIWRQLNANQSYIYL